MLIEWGDGTRPIAKRVFLLHVKNRRDEAAPLLGTCHGQVRAVVDSTVRFVDSDRRRGRVLYHEALGNEALNRRRVESSFAVADLIAGGAKERRVAASFVVGGFSEVLMGWLDGRIKVSRARLIDQVTDLFLSIER